MTYRRLLTRSVSFAVLIIFFLGFWTFAQSSTRSTRPRVPRISATTGRLPVWLGRWGDGPASSVAISEPYALVGSGSVLIALDVSDRENPFLVGKIDAGGRIRQVLLQGHLAYVAAERAGVRIVDISDPGNLRQVGAFDSGNAAYFVAASGDLVFVSEPGLVRAVNFANLELPVEVSEIRTSVPQNASSVKSLNGHLFVSDVSVIRIFNVTSQPGVEEVSSYHASSNLAALEPVGNMVYYGNASGLHVLDVSNAANPVEVNIVSTANVPARFFSNGAYLYVSAAGQGLRVFDISQPTAPKEVWAYRYTVADIAVSQDSAFVATGSAGLSILDVSNPEQKPEAIYALSTLPQTSSMDFAVKDQYAYVVENQGSLRVFDLSNPGLPEGKASVTIGGNASSLALSDSHAFVVGSDGLAIFDISNRTAPVRLTRNHNISGRAIAAVGNFVYTVDVSGLRVVDVSTPTAPVQVAFLSDFKGKSLAVDGNRACVIGYSDVRLLDVTNTTQPVQIGSVNIKTSESCSATIAGQRLFLATGSSLQILNISNPSSIVLVKAVDMPAQTVCVIGTRLYLGDAVFLHLLDISEIENPVELVHYPAFGQPMKLIAGDDFLYFVDASRGLAVLSVSDIAALKALDSVTYYELPWANQSVTVSGTHAFVVEPTSLRIFDVSDRGKPQQVGVWRTSGSLFKAVAAGRYVYVIDQNPGLHVIDVQDPRSPVQAGFSNLNGALPMDLAVRDSYAYVASFGAGFQVVSVSDPTNPKVAGSADTGLSISVAIAGNWACVGGQSYGLRFVDISNPASPRVDYTTYPIGHYTSLTSDGRLVYGVDRDHQSQNSGLVVIGGPAQIVATCPVPRGVTGVAVQGEMLLAAGSGLLRVFNIADPSKPREFTSRETAGEAASVAVGPGVVAIADGSCGLSIYGW